MLFREESEIISLDRVDRVYQIGHFSWVWEEFIYVADFIPSHGIHKCVPQTPALTLIHCWKMWGKNLSLRKYFWKYCLANLFETFTPPQFSSWHYYSTTHWCWQLHSCCCSCPSRSWPPTTWVHKRALRRQKRQIQPDGVNILLQQFLPMGWWALNTVYSVCSIQVSQA